MRKFILFLFIVICLSGAPIFAQQHEKLNNDDENVPRVAATFTKRLLETLDFKYVVDELYAKDFIQRYLNNKIQQSTRDHIITVEDFSPGLNYQASLLKEATVADWRKFYIATNNFLFFGFLSGYESYSDKGGDIKPEDLYPKEVIDLLDKNPNLANMIEKKGAYIPLSTVEEMRSATSVLEHAVAILGGRYKEKPMKKGPDYAEIVKLMKEDQLFQPRFETLDEEYFDFPKGTRISHINTPVFVTLLTVRTEGGYKIFWSVPFTGD